MNLSLTDFKLFVAVAELGNLTRAAQRCHLSLPAVSQRIQAMEQQARCKLLERRARGVDLTAAGDTFAQHARAMLLEADSMSAALSAFAGGLQGNITVLANTTAVSELMPKVLAAFLAAHEQVTVSLREHGNREIARAVREGRADVGIVAGDVDFSGLEATHFATDRLVLVVAHRHPLARRAKATFADVVDLPMVGLYEGSTIQRFLAERVEAMGRPPMRPRIEVNNFDAICLMAEAGVGIGVVPASVVQRLAGGLKIKAVALSDAWAVRKRYVLTRPLASRPQYVRDLVAAIHAAAAGVGAV